MKQKVSKQRGAEVRGPRTRHQKGQGPAFLLTLNRAEQKRGNVDSQNPGSNLHLAGPGETPTRPRLNRDQAQPFECQSVSPPSPRATGGGGGRRSGPSRGSPVLARWDVAN
ncbi:hypothetical protein R6Z07M_007017 [Ovis aries]